MDPFVDVAFPLKGKSLPLDHGYALFGAVSRVLPVLHKEESWGLFPVHGQRLGPGELGLLSTSLLTIRMPASRIADTLPLSGQSLAVDGHLLSVGVPRIFTLQPKAALHSRFVTIKKFHDDRGEFAAAVRRQLDLHRIGSTTKVVVGDRRVIKVSSHTIVGFVLDLEGLNESESTLVQTHGIGGRRHMGAGLFLPRGTT